MKKKVLVVSLIIAALAITLVGGTLAWFMDTDEATNVFTVGSIDITQKEDFVQNAQLLPVVGDDPLAADDNYVKKAVSVSNDGKNAAYVQTYVAVPSVLDDNGILKRWNNSSADWEITEVATGVTIAGETVSYDVYRYRYAKKLEPGITTSNSLEYVYIDKQVDLNVADANTAYFVAADGTEITGFNAAGPLNVYVITQGTQAKGFASHTAALDASFKEHPWA